MYNAYTAGLRFCASKLFPSSLSTLILAIPKPFPLSHNSILISRPILPFVSYSSSLIHKCSLYSSPSILPSLKYPNP